MPDRAPGYLLATKFRCRLRGSRCGSSSGLVPAKNKCAVLGQCFLLCARGAAPSSLSGRARPGGARPGEVPGPGCHHAAGGPDLAARCPHPTAVGTGALCGVPCCPGARCPAWRASLSSPMPTLPTTFCKQSGQKGARAGARHPPEEQQGPLPLRAAPRRLRVALVRTPLWMELFSCLSLTVAEPSRASARPCFLEKQPSSWASSYMTLLPRSSPRTAGIVPSSNSSFPSFSFRESFPRRDLHPH